MIKLSFTILAFFLFVINISFSQTTTEIDFIDNDYKKALRQAKKEGKIIFVDVYASWCRSCKNLASITFAEESVSDKFNSEFINLKIDGDLKDGYEFLEKYEFDSYPTMFFISADEEVLRKVVGYKTAQELILQAEIAKDPSKSPYNIAKKKIEEKDNYSRSDLYEFIKAAFDEDMSCDKQIAEYLSFFKPEDMKNNDSVFSVFCFGNMDKSSPYTGYFINNFDYFLDIYGGLGIAIAIKRLIANNLETIATEDENKLYEFYDFIEPVYRDDDFEEVKKQLNEVYELYKNNLIEKE